MTFKEKFPELNDNQIKQMKRELLELMPKRYKYKNRLFNAMTYNEPGRVANDEAADKAEQAIEEYFK